MDKTLSLHGGRMASIAHNRREQGKEGKQSTIKNELTENNVTLIDMDIKEAYKQLFQESVDDYNKTQKRSDRKIKNYYSKIHNDKKKNTHYEYIFQLGNIKNRIDDDTFIAVCSDYVASFQNRNQNLFLIGAYIHLDEEASPHMHMDYIPIGHYDKGMRLQASSNKAFEELTGYKSQSKRDTAQIKWQESEREYIRECCKQYDIEIVDGDSKGKKSLSIAEYKAQQDMKQAQQAIEQAEQLQKHADAEIGRQTARIQSAQREADQQIQKQKEQTQKQLEALEQSTNEQIEKHKKDSQKRIEELKQKEEQQKIELESQNKELKSINVKLQGENIAYENRNNVLKKNNKTLKDINSNLQKDNAAYTQLESEALENKSQLESFLKIAKKALPEIEDDFINLALVQSDIKSIQNTLKKLPDLDDIER